MRNTTTITKYKYENISKPYYFFFFNYSLSWVYWCCKFFEFLSHIEYIKRMKLSFLFFLFTVFSIKKKKKNSNWINGEIKKSWKFYKKNEGQKWKKNNEPRRSFHIFVFTPINTAEQSRAERNLLHLLITKTQDNKHSLFLTAQKPNIEYYLAKSHSKIL